MGTEKGNKMPNVSYGNWGQSSWPMENFEITSTKKNHQILQTNQNYQACTTFDPTSGNKTLRGRRLDIKGPSGSVRGYKNVVRISLEHLKIAISKSMGRQFFGSSNLIEFSNLRNGENNNNKNIMDHYYRSMYLEKLNTDERDICVLYTTTLGVIRRTFEDSKMMKSILDLNLIKYQERDIYLNQEFKQQLKCRLGPTMIVPVLFVGGKYFGQAKELEQLNESGELSLALSKFKMLSAKTEVCLCCGNARFIACPNCHGSRKSTIHHFKFNSIALRCIRCDKNEGLVQCPACQ